MKGKWMKIVRQYTIITLGISMMAVGVYFFKFPNNFVFGGVTGAAALAAKLTPISASEFSAVVNMLMLLLGLIFLGKEFALTTGYATVVLSAELMLLEKACPLNEPLSDQPMLELIFAIALPAIASALLFSVGASSGGTDIVAMILKRHTSVNIGNCLLCVDFLITVAACVAFGMETGLFSMLGLVLKSVIVDMVLENIKVHKCFQIITEKPSEIVHFIVTVLGRGATELHGEGAYTHEDKTVILTVANRYQAIKLRKYTREVDPHSFVLITNSTEIIGKGFRGLM